MRAPLSDRIRTKRWNEPKDTDDGYRLLVTRLRPRGVARANETWDGWCEHLGPSRDLLFAYKGKDAPPIPWAEYEGRYLEEMKGKSFWLKGYAAMLARGERLTLLCASTCVDPARCHRTLLRELILRAAKDLATEGGAGEEPADRRAARGVVRREATKR